MTGYLLVGGGGDLIECGASVGCKVTDTQPLQNAPPLQCTATTNTQLQIHYKDKTANTHCNCRVSLVTKNVLFETLVLVIVFSSF